MIEPMFLSLPNSYKNRFPFRLATTSFIYPDTWSANAKMLAPYLDEIELTIFESSPASLPAPDEIDRLCSVSESEGIGYNVHLPIDLKLGSGDRELRRHAVRSVLEITALTRPLKPTAFTVHLELEGSLSDPAQIKTWQARSGESLDRILDAGLPPNLLAVENLVYPIEIIEEMILDRGLMICLDIGHLTLIGGSFSTTFTQYEDRISILHLCGIGCKGEHLALEKLPGSQLQEVSTCMENFSGTVSLEVFSYKDLVASLNTFDTIWQ